MLFILILFISCKLDVACLVSYDDEKLDTKWPVVAKKQLHKEITQFNLESDAALKLAMKYFDRSIRNFVSADGSDFSIISHLLAYFSIALFDSIAPYDREAVGILSNIERRSDAEGSTDEKFRNTAILFATYSVGVGLIPNSKHIFQDMLKESLVDVSAISDYLQSEDITTPQGIGNVVAKKVVELARQDNMNILGNKGSGIHNFRPYFDYTGYKPVNSASSIKDPTRWQPDILSRGAGHFGAFISQQFITPQLRNMRTFAFKKDLSDIIVQPPGRVDQNNQLYESTTNQVVQTSAYLTKRQKVVCETFHDKLRVFTTTFMHIWESRLLSQQEAVHFLAAISIASIDNYIGVWKQKYEFDAVRPFTAIRYLYKESSIKAYGTAEKDNDVVDIPARHWKSFIQTPDHPEYPSGTASFCSAIAEVARKWWLDGDKIGPKTTNMRQSQKNEYLITPELVPLHFYSNTNGPYGPESKPIGANDESLHYWTWTELEEDCGASRVWGGVNFNDTIMISRLFGKQFADDAISYIKERLYSGIKDSSSDNYYYGKTLWPSLLFR